MENFTESVSAQNLSPENQKILELLTEISADQKLIFEQNQQLLKIEKTKKLWNVAKWILLILIFVVPLLFLPAMFDAILEGLNPGNLLQSSDPEAMKILEQLLGG
ncbi:hypothetical protein HN954_02685 [bacterium]|jgi:hypothetical protein|nr:hypothetical protein [bacterium]MBT6831665.1 hypothetical protein [bacterium]MBT6996311.1 hypothetical protein [bacterium]MBT7772989.1 hypothetical protein [bacterium]